MPTTTPRLALIKPAAVGEIIDIAQLNANADVIDANIGFKICTSTTRPNAPYPGMQIFETDTGCTNFWNGTEWYGDTNWVVPAMQNGWVNVVPGGENYEGTAYRRINNIVHIKGLVGNGGLGPTQGMFILPAGFRTLKTATFIAPSASSSAVLAYNSGTLYVAAYNTGGSNANVSIRLSFPAEA